MGGSGRTIEYARHDGADLGPQPDALPFRRHVEIAGAHRGQGSLQAPHPDRLAHLDPPEHVQHRRSRQAVDHRQVRGEPGHGGRLLDGIDAHGLSFERMLVSSGLCDRSSRTTAIRLA